MLPSGRERHLRLILCYYKGLTRFPAPKELKSKILLGAVSTPSGVCGCVADIDWLRHVTWLGINACRLGWFTSTVAARIIMDFMSDRDAQKVSVNFTFAGKAAERRARFTTLNDANSHKWSIIRMILRSPFYSDACCWETSLFTVSSSRNYFPM